MLIPAKVTGTAVEPQLTFVRNCDSNEEVLYCSAYDANPCIIQSGSFAFP